MTTNDKPTTADQVLTQVGEILGDNVFIGPGGDLIKRVELAKRALGEWAAARAGITYKMSVAEEKRVLDEKIQRLNEFLRRGALGLVSDAEFDRLLRQQSAMSAYSGILGERIEGFKA